MAAMALRSPPNGAQIVQEGGITAMLEAMRRHPTAQGLQRQVSPTKQLSPLVEITHIRVFSQQQLRLGDQLRERQSRD